MQEAIFFLDLAARECEDRAVVHSIKSESDELNHFVFVATECRQAIEILHGSPLKNSPGHRIS